MGSAAARGDGIMSDMAFIDLPRTDDLTAADVLGMPRPAGSPRQVPQRRGDLVIEVPAGAWFIIDPCYTFAHDTQGFTQWRALLSSSAMFGYDDNQPGGIGTIPVPDSTDAAGAPVQVQLSVAAVSTAHGDGVYYDTDGHAYGVDAGMIGVVPAWWGATSGAHTVPELLDLGRLVLADAAFQITIAGPNGGLLRFGDIEIDTD